MGQDSKTITVKVYLITFLLVTMKKVPYQSLFPTLSTRAGVAVALLGLTRRGSKRYGVAPFCSSTFTLSSFSSADDICTALLLEPLLLRSSAMFSVFLGHHDEVTGLINIRTCLRAMTNIGQLSIKSRLRCFTSYF